MKSIGKNIKEIRTKKNIKQEELAEKLFVTRQTVSNYETSKSQPDIDMLMKIAEALDTDVNALLYGEARQPEDIAKRKKQFIKKMVVIIALWMSCYICAYFSRHIHTYALSLGLLYILLIQPLALITTTYIMTDYLPISVSGQIKDNLLAKLLWGLTLIFTIIMILSPLPHIIQGFVKDYVYQHYADMGRPIISYEYFFSEWISDIIFKLSNALGYQIKFRFLMLTYQSRFDIPVLILSGAILKLFKPKGKLYKIIKKTVIVLVSAVFIISVGLTALSIEEPVKSDNLMMWNTDFSPWYQSQDVNADVLYSTQMHKDGGVSGWSTETDTYKGGLQCLAKLQLGKEVNTTFPKDSGHSLSLIKIVKQDDGEYAKVEEHIIVFSEDYKYVRMAYTDDKRVYEIKNPNEIEWYFTQYAR